MKKSMLIIFAAAVLVACKKNENTVAESSADTMATYDSSNLAVNDSVTGTDSASTAGTGAESNTSLSNHDKMFADEAAKGGMMEVSIGQLVSANASDASVKTLGEMMVRDHTKANNELKQWASNVGYTLPTEMDVDQQNKFNSLKMKKGADFDRAYTDLMVTDHKKDIASFKKESLEGGDSSLKSFAGKTLPTLEHHLMESEKSKAAVK